MINTVTLNPAMDRILEIDTFRLNCMNRIQYTVDCIGGKGTHIAYNLALLGVENRTFGIASGNTGKEIIRILTECGARTEYIWRETPESRTNYLMIDEHKNCTFLAETGQTLSTAITDELLARIDSHAETNDILVIAGDASNVEDRQIQVKLLDMAREKEMKLYLDSSGAFMKRGIAYRPYMIKPNMEELSELVEYEVHTPEDVVKAIGSLPDIPMIMVSMGADGWIFRFEGKLRRGYGLKVPVKNTAGCGDALLSALLYAFEYTDTDMEEKLAFATAVSAACAMAKMTVGFDINDVKRLQKDVVIEEIQ